MPEKLSVDCFVVVTTRYGLRVPPWVFNERATSARVSTAALIEPAQAKEVRAARITGVAAVSGAIVGALLAAVSAYTVTTVQQSSEAEQAQRAFLRSEQRTSYATLITADAALQDAESNWYYAVILLLPSFDPSGASERLSSAKDGYRGALASVRLVGSDSAALRAERLASIHRNWDSAATDAFPVIRSINAFEDHRTPEETNRFQAATDKVLDADVAIDQGIADFIKQARLDLGSTGP